MDAANRHLETRSVERLAGGKDHRRRPDGSCGIAIMAKASAPGRTKTRLVPPLTFEQAAALNTAFLQDITGNLLTGRESCGDCRLRRFRARRDRSVFPRHPAAGIGLIDACLPTLGDCLLRTLQEIFGRGHASAVVLNSDSPTLPTALLVETANMLAQPGERAVLGPSTDGGYYLLGLKTSIPPLVRGHHLGHRAGCSADPGTGARTEARRAHAATLVRC